MSVPEIITVNSEALQATVRDLLPSQNGFGSELQASNVIMPIIDLTASAEGSSLAQDLSRALAFGSQTAFDASGATVTVTSNAGFHRVIGTATLNKGAGDLALSFQVNDTSSTQIVWSMELTGGSGTVSFGVPFDFIVFLRSGDSLEAITNNSSAHVTGSSRQVATVTGTLVNPSGFVAE
jgi:hypothetical protein